MATSLVPHRRTGVAFLLLGAALAACSGTTGYTSRSAPTSGPPAPAATVTSSAGNEAGYGGYGGKAPQPSGTAAALSVRTVPSLGQILADGSGRALYLFQKDPSGASSCTGSCAQVWPPLTTTGTPAAGAGVAAGLVTVLRRPDGTSQVAYAGHPLYYYVADHGAGQTTGQGLNQFGAQWYVLSPKGAKIDKDGS